MSIEYIDKSHARLVVSKGSGKNRERRVKRITYTSKRDAQNQYKEFERSVNFAINQNMTISDLLNWYITSFEQAGGKRTTVQGYITAKNAVIAVLGKKKAASVTLPVIDDFVRKNGEKYAPKSLKNQLSLLNASYKHAIRRGVLQDNPCQYAMLPRQQRADISVLSDEALPVFLLALDSQPLDFKVACELALFLGLRRSEVLGLKHGDVGKTVTINKVRHRIGRENVLQTPKTAASVRTIAVPKFIRDDVAALIKEHKQRPAQNDYLIQNGFGEPVNPSWISRHMEEVRKETCLDITFHGLRHTCASMLISKGIPISEISAHLGHASIDITLRTYAHLFTEATTASERISAVFEGLMAPNGHQNQ